MPNRFRLRYSLTQKTSKFWGHKQWGKTGWISLSTPWQPFCSLRGLWTISRNWSSPLKSPANMAGFVGLDMASGIMPFCYWEEVLKANPQTQMILDVRNPEELTGDSVKGALNLPLDKLHHGIGLEKLDKTKDILTYCGMGVRGYIATRYLLAHGYKARNILGGFKTRLNFRDN